MLERKKRISRKLFLELKHFEPVFSSQTLILRRARLPEGVIGPKFAIVMSVAHAGTHVVRNRYRRRYQEIIRTHKDDFSPLYAYQLILRPPVRELSFLEAVKEVSLIMGGIRTKKQ